MRLSGAQLGRWLGAGVPSLKPENHDVPLCSCVGSHVFPAPPPTWQMLSWKILPNGACTPPPLAAKEQSLSKAQFMVSGRKSDLVD